jgi:hypothetical protein
MTKKFTTSECLPRLMHGGHLSAHERIQKEKDANDKDDAAG